MTNARPGPDEEIAGETTRPQRGPIAWMARNSVAANLLMLVLLIGGVFSAFQIKQEYLPNIEPDNVEIAVEMFGAAPAEVEQAIVLVIEDALSGVEGIAKIGADAGEGMAGIRAELEVGADRQAVYNDIRQAVDGISTFPEDAEEPVVKLSGRRFGVLEIHLSGDTTPFAIRMAAEHVRAHLLQQPGLSQVEIADEAEIVLNIDVSESALLSHGLTLRQISDAVRGGALERSGGTLETDGGDLLVRLADRRESVEDFAAIPVISSEGGAILRLGDLADLSLGFKDQSKISQFDGMPATEVEVFRVGDQTPITVSDAVRAALPDAMATLPAGIEAQIFNDRSDYYRGRMDLLIKNGLIGLALVLLLLSLFLEIRLAFWVALGIPVAFMGAMLVLPTTDSTINLVSMFAFIVALGIVVDDAIVAGENIYEYRQRGYQRLEAAVEGARNIAVPLTFSILTNIVAFMPIAIAPTWLGQLWMVVPIVVSLAFIMSWVEALYILPAHLSHKPAIRFFGPVAWVIAAFGAVERYVFGPVQRTFAGGLAVFIQSVYGPLLQLALRWRYVTAATMVIILMIAIAWVSSGRMGFGLFPPVPRDYSKADITMPIGTPLAVTEAARDEVVAAALRVKKANGGDDLVLGIQSRIDGRKIEIRTHLTEPGVRPISTVEFSQAWRKEVGQIPSVRSARFESSWGGRGSTSLSIRLSHADTKVLEVAAGALAAELAEFSSVRDPEDGFTVGKQQIEFRLTETGHSLGLTSAEIARQVRAAFQGIEAVKQQDGRNEVTVLIRRPEGERSSEAAMENLLMQTPDGGLAPLYEVATIEKNRADSRIIREDGRRVVNVTANVEPRSETNQIAEALRAEVLPKLMGDYPGLGWSMQGNQNDMMEVIDHLKYFSGPLALLLIYGLLAIPFRSYLQPLVIMMAIPFGFVGAVIGHEIMGYGLSVISIFGIIALSGVVINAGIVMIDYANKKRQEGASARDAIWQAGKRRFRPILLTTVTTFGGLAPMIFETSRQAKFMIPMAISLGYGIVFATLIVLFLIPALYLVLEDLKSVVSPQDEPEDEGGLPIPAE
ncbi:MAG: efflux RND transporter permease subunit [Pseudomonadota bacterium]